MRAFLSSARRIAHALVFAGACIVAASALAAEQRFALLLDTDNSAATGCTVATAKGAVAGVDQVWTTVVTTSTTAVTVMEIDKQVCSGGTLGSAVEAAAGGWPVGMGNGVDGTGAIESWVPRSALPASGTMKVVVTGTNADGGADATAAFLVDLGSTVVPATPAQPIPMAPLLAPLLVALLAGLGLLERARRARPGMAIVALLVLANAGLVLAADVVLDGNVGDWAGVAQVAGNAKGSAPVDANVVGVFYQFQDDRLYWRIDADLALDTTTGPTNTVPTVSAGAPQTISLPATATLSGSATDDGLPNPPGALTYSWSQDSGPGGATIVSPGTAVTLVTFTQVGSYVFRLTVSDSALSTSATTQVNVGASAVVTDTAPTLGDQGNVTLPVGTTFTRSLTATDPDAGDTLTFALVSSPAGMTLSGATLQWATTGASPGHYPVVVRVTDAAGMTDTKQFLITLTQYNPPLAYDDHYPVVLGQTLSVPAAGVLANDVDPGGASLAATLLTNPALGTLTAFNADGSFVYTAPAVATPAFDPAVLWQTTLAYNTTAMLVAPVLGDGQPYVIESNYNNVYAINAKDGSILWHVAGAVGVNYSCSLGGYLASSIFAQVIGDIDDSGSLSIVFPTECAPNGFNEYPARLIALNARDGSFKWLSPPLGQLGTDASGNPGPFGPAFPHVDPILFGAEPTLARLAPNESPSIVVGVDLGIGNYGGQPECAQLVAGWPAATACRGVVVVDGKDGSVRRTMAAPRTARGAADANLYSNGTQSPVVADLDGTGTQQIIYGGAVFNADGSVKWNSDGADFGTPASSYTWWNGVANLDDTPDVEIVRLTGFQAYAPYELAAYKSDGSVLWELPFAAANLNVLPPVIADVDASGYPSILLSVGNPARYLCAVDHTGHFKWCYDAGIASDGGSNLRSGTMVSVYDLEGTGVPSVIVQIYDGKIIFLDGSNGVLKSTFDVKAAISAPYTMYSTSLGGPIVADVDGSGHAALLTAWAGTTADPIIAIRSSANTWRPARPIFNQAMYYPGAINDDGTLPASFVNSFADPITNVFGVQPQITTPVDPLTYRQAAFTYAASDGVASSAPAKVAIDLLPVIQPLRFTSRPPTFYQTSAASFAYQAVVLDPNAGGTPTFKIISERGGNVAASCTIVATTGLFSCAAGFGSGVQSFIIVATDQYGATAAQSFTLQPSTGSAAVPNVVGALQADAASTLVAAGFAVGNVTRMYSATPAGEVAQQNPAAGTSEPLLTPVDLVVSLGPQHPAGPAPSLTGIARIVVAPATTAVRTGESVAYSAVASYGDATSADITTYATWASSAPAVATVDVAGKATAVGAGSTQLIASVGAVSGSAALTVVARAVDPTPPMAAITSPADGDPVTTVTPIVGTATDANFVRYELAVASSGSTTFTTIGVGTTPVVGGTLGSFDPTLLLNGAYTLRLAVFDAGGNETDATIGVVVNGQQKPGLFTLHYTDLNVAAAGIPLTVTRTYDSRDKTVGDFGVGWRLGLNTMRVSQSVVQGNAWHVAGSSTSYALVADRVHTVSITLPDGRVQTFDLQITPTLSPLVPFTTLTAAYVPESGTLGALLCLDNTNLLIADPQPGVVTLLDDMTIATFDPKHFRYTNIDGTQFEFDATGITKVTDARGNSTTFSASGITSSSGQSVVFTRDGQHRITAITDPLGNVQTYSYDDHGDLAGHVTATGGTSTYAYDYRHDLLSMVDPDGNTAVRNTYDDAGHLIASTDASGHTITYANDPGAQTTVITDRLGNVSTIAYDSNGNITSTQTPVTIAGSLVLAATSATYDSLGNVLTSIDPDGIAQHVTWSGYNPLTQVTDPAGLALTTSYVYNANNDATQVTDAGGRVYTMTYTASHLVPQASLPGMGTYSGTFDGSGNLATSTDSLGTVKSYTYDSAGNETREDVRDAASKLLRRTDHSHDANGNVLTETVWRTIAGTLTAQTTTFAYDAANRLVATTDALGNVSRVEYDAADRVTAQVDALGRRTTMTYDTLGRLVQTTWPDGNTTMRSYDANGNVVSETDPAGRITNYAYDELGRRVSTTKAAGTTQTLYSAGGRVDATVDANGNRTDYGYDSANRPASVQYPAVANGPGGALTRPQVTSTLNASGQATSSTDANGNVTQMSYDANGKLVQTTLPDGHTVQQTFDALGRRTSTTNEEGQVASYSYDALGRLVAVSGVTGSEQYAYDEAGNLVSRTDALGRVTTFSYDALGRLLQRIWPGGDTEQFAYDAVGNRVAYTDGSSRVTSYSYDAMNRLASKLLPGGATVTYAYAADGQRTSVTDARGTTSYAYDAAGRLATETKPDGAALHYGYDGNDNLTQLASPAATIAYQYDANDRLAQVVAPAGTITSAYDLTGNRLRLTAANGMVSDATFDVRNRLAQVTHKTAGGTLLRSYAYDYSPASRVTQAVEDDGSVDAYTYDAQGRLASETRTGTDAFTATHAYDAVGNRTQTTRGGTTTNYSYDSDDHLVGDGSATYTWDANGNLATKTSSAGTVQYTWDPENRLVAVLGGGLSDQYVYDDDGNRVQATNAGGTVNFLVDANNPTGLSQVLEERDAGNALLASYVFGSGLVTLDHGGDVRVPLADGGGNVRALTDTSAAATDGYTYDAWGRSVAASGTSSNPYRYRGQRLDADTAQYLLRARYYDPASGRFFARDPLDGQPEQPLSLHRYLYANADPVDYADPTGRDTMLEVTEAQAIDAPIEAVSEEASLMARCTMAGSFGVIQDVQLLETLAFAVPWSNSKATFYYEWKKPPYLDNIDIDLIEIRASGILFNGEEKKRQLTVDANFKFGKKGGIAFGYTEAKGFAGSGSTTGKLAKISACGAEIAEIGVKVKIKVGFGDLGLRALGAQHGDAGVFGEGLAIEFKANHLPFKLEIPIVDVDTHSGLKLFGGVYTFNPLGESGAHGH